MASTLTIKVAGNPVNFVYGSWKLQKQIDQQDRCSFTIIDSTGSANFQKRQPVVVSDSVQGTLWTGYVDKARASKLAPQPHRLWTIDCIDQTYLPNKRTSNKIYANQYAGTIVADQVQRYLASEGVTGDFALDWDELQTDFQAGTLTNVIATTNSHDGNNGDGDLELALSGTDLVYTSSPVSAGPTMSLKLQGTAVQGVNNNYVYRKIWQGTSFTIQAGDHLDYQVWISSTSPQIMAGVDFVCTDGTTFRDSTGAGTDAQGILPHPKIDLSGYANDQWYSRSFGVGSPLIGKTLQYVSVAFEGDNAGTYTAYFKNIYYYKTGGTVQQIIFDNTMTAPALNNLISVNGYNSVTLTAIQTYDPLTFISTSASINQVKLVKGSYIAWDEDKNKQQLLVSMDNGASAVQVHSGDSIPYLTPGMDVTGRSLVFYLSTIFGTDPSLVEFSSFPAFKLVVYTSYNATKSDSITQYGESNAAFSTGTFTDTKDDGGNNLTINGFTRNYDDTNYSSQTMFGSALVQQGILMRQFYLEANPSGDIRSRMDFAGTWNNFTAEVDIKLTVNGNLGIEYRTTNWSNTVNTYAYNAYVTPTQVSLAKGSNGGAGSFTNVVTPVTVAFTDGSWHRLKVIISGSNHKVYVDDILYINATDSTYNGTSNVALRFYNSSAGVAFGYFGNFGIVSNLTGIWISPSINIAGPGTYGSSVIFWDTLITPDTTSVTAQTSIDGGSTYQNVTNGGAISGLTAGQSLAGKTLKLKLTLTAANASVLPTVEGVTAWVLGQFSATGTRIGPALSLAAVGRAGASLVNWNALNPTNTSVAVSTSIDGGSSYQSVAAAGNAISGITVQPDPTVDTFSTITVFNYTQVNSIPYSYAMRAFGSTLRIGTPTWMWDMVNSRLIANGGTNAYLIYTSLTSTDVDIIVDMDQSENGGAVWHWTSANNTYRLRVRDGSAVTGPNTLALQKVVSGTSSVLGSVLAISFKRGTPHRFRVTMLGNVINIYYDGALMQTYTDASSPFTSGQSGLWNSGGIAQFYQLRTQPQGNDVTSLSVLTQVTLTSTDATVTPALLDLQTFVAGLTIGTGVLIPSANYQNTFVWNNISDQNKQSNYWCNIDPITKKIIFQARNAQPAPWIIASANASTQVGSQTIGDVLVDGLTLENSGDAYRNRQTLKGVKATGAFSKTIIGDGKATSWTLDYPVAVDTVPTITLNNQSQTVGIKGVATGKNFYYQAGSTSLEQDGSGTVLQITDTLTVSYTGSFTTNLTFDNTGQPMYAGTVSQSQMAVIEDPTGHTSGIVEAVEDVSSQNMDVPTATTYGQQLLLRYGVIGQILTYKTLRQGLAPGQQVPVFVPEQATNDVQFLVSSLEITATQGQDASGNPSVLYWYGVTALTGPMLGTWVRMFANALKGT